MNRYPVWKYAIIVIALLVSALYALPNVFGEAPAVQVSVVKASMKLDASTLAKVEKAIQTAGIAADAVVLDGASIKARFSIPTHSLRPRTKFRRHSTLMPLIPPMWSR